MIEINLLPWRAILRAENAKRKKFFLICLGALTLIWIVSYIGFRLITQNYDTTIASLQNQLTELTSQTQQNPINPSLLIVDQIHASQLELLDFFKVLAQEMQGMIVWSAIVSKNNYILIRGNTDSFAILADFVGAYNMKNKVLPIDILNAKKNNDASSLQFNLRLARSVPSLLSQIKNDDNA